MYTAYVTFLLKNGITLWTLRPSPTPLSPTLPASALMPAKYIFFAAQLSPNKLKSVLTEIAKNKHISLFTARILLQLIMRREQHRTFRYNFSTLTIV